MAEEERSPLKALQAGCHPKDVIAALAEDLLAHYTGQPLIDPYDIYQHLMDYWAETMQDDCYLIAADGWKAETTRVIETDKKGKEKDKGWTCDLIPKPLFVARYYAKEQAKIDQLVAELESVTAKLAELEEEHGSEDGAFADLDKVNKAKVATRLKEIKDDKEAKDEVAVLNDWLKLNTEEADLKRPQGCRGCARCQGLCSLSQTQGGTRSRLWWWMKNGSPPSMPPSTARWIA